MNEIRRNISGAIGMGAVLRQKPHAVAVIKGSSNYPEINGKVLFYQMRSGVLIAAEIFGLPSGDQITGDQICESPVFGFHIHSGSSCGGKEEEPFGEVLEHYNPHRCMHPHHAGDMPPLFGNNGYAFLAFFSDRFKVAEIIGKTVIIHSMRDDFTTQPGGNAGEKMACGLITIFNKK